MSDVKSGPLAALIDYYQRLEDDPDQSVAEFGFSREKIHKGFAAQYALRPSFRGVSFWTTPLIRRSLKPCIVTCC